MVRKLNLIEKSFGDFPLGALSAKRTRGVFKRWRNDLAKRSKRQADYAWVVLARVLSWALDNDLVDTNPCEKGGRLYGGGNRAEKVWSDDQESAFLAKAPKHPRLPFVLAIWTAQRQGDLLWVPWSGYDGTYIRLRQSKTGMHVTILVGATLKHALDAAKAARGNATTILVTTEGMPWTGDGFRSSWRKACKKASVTGADLPRPTWQFDHTFGNCRGDSVGDRYHSGLSLGDVRGILDRHYLHNDVALAESAIRKLEDRSIRKP